MLAFIILKSELLPKDEKRACNLLLHSVSLEDDKAEYALAKLLLKSNVIPINKKQDSGLIRNNADRLKKKWRKA